MRAPPVISQHTGFLSVMRGGDCSTCPSDALIPQHRIGSILRGMRALRTADEMLYLRSASINIFNGMISLTFSCDGTHYMSYREFLDKDMHFWFGDAA